MEYSFLGKNGFAFLLQEISQFRCGVAIKKLCKFPHGNPLKLSLAVSIFERGSLLVEVRGALVGGGELDGFGFTEKFA